MKALIVIFLKPNKDVRHSALYCPNCNVKITVLRLATLIYPDQSGFMQGKGTHDTIRYLYLHIYQAYFCNRSSLIIYLDVARFAENFYWRLSPICTLILCVLLIYRAVDGDS